MHYLLIVEVSQSILKLPENPCRNVAESRSFFAREGVEKRHTIDPLHRYPKGVTEHKLLVNPHDIGVRQPRKDPIFSVEVGRSSDVVNDGFKNDGFAFRTGLAPVDAPHPTLSKQTEDLVLIVVQASHGRNRFRL